MILYQSEVNSLNETITSHCIPCKNEVLVFNYNSNHQLVECQLKSKEENNIENQQLISTDKFFTLLPTNLINSISNESIKNLLDWNDEVNVINTSDVKGYDLSIVHGSKVTEQNDKNFISTSHLTVYLLQAALAKKAFTLKQGIFACISDNRLTLAIYENSELLLCNAFDVSNNDEVLYYLMLIIQEYKFSQESMNLILYGNCVNDDSLEQELNNYIRNVELIYNVNIANKKYSGLATLIQDTL